MPLYRIIIEGSAIRTHDGAVGFFSSRTVTQPTRQAAEMLVLRTIHQDWRLGTSANLSPTKPLLRVVDGWQLSLIDRLRRIPDTSYRYYPPGGRATAAAAEAAHVRGRKNGGLRQIAEEAGENPAPSPEAAVAEATADGV